MEPLAPFELDALRRDWIGGISGDELYNKVLRRVAALEDREGIVTLCEKDAIEFSAAFFATVWTGLPVALANSQWGTKERAQFDRLVEPLEIGRGSILIPTGGTTGGVKLAIHDWSSLQASVHGLMEFLGGGAIDSCCVLPLYHVSGLMQLMRAFVSEGTIDFYKDAVDGRCLSLVPTQLHRLMQNEPGHQKLKAARAIFVGGAAMPKSVKRQARELELPVVPVYGMTETAAMVAAVPNEDFLDGEETGAIPLGDAQFSIDADSAVRVKSSSLFKGYLGAETPDLSDGFRTGDAGRIDESGRLHIFGRLDHLINSGGEKVDPAEVERALLGIEAIEQAKVVGEADDEWGEVVVALVKPFAGSTPPDAEEIRSMLKPELSAYKIPKQIRFI